jgi:hypothetical protein
MSKMKFDVCGHATSCWKNVVSTCPAPWVGDHKDHILQLLQVPMVCYGALHKDLLFPLAIPWWGMFETVACFSEYPVQVNFIHKRREY